MFDRRGSFGHAWSRVMPGLTPQQMFDLVCDAQSYPTFVPGCIEARIVHRRPGHWVVDNVVGFGPIRSRFSSVASFDPPGFLDIRSEEGPWRRFQMNWRFEPEGAGCRVECRTTFAFRSQTLARLAELGFDPAAAAITRGFERRADMMVMDGCMPRR